MNNTPRELWIDARVVKTIPQEPDENKAAQGIEQVRYFSAEAVRDLMARREPAEFFVQVTVDKNDGRVYGLSNYGRLFYLAFPPDDATPHWVEVATPNFAGGQNAQMEKGG